MDTTASSWRQYLAKMTSNEFDLTESVLMEWPESFIQKDEMVQSQAAAANFLDKKPHSFDGALSLDSYSKMNSSLEEIGAVQNEELKHFTSASDSLLPDFHFNDVPRIYNMDFDAQPLDVTNHVDHPKVKTNDPAPSLYNNNWDAVGSVFGEPYLKTIQGDELTHMCRDQNRAGMSLSSNASTSPDMSAILMDQFLVDSDLQDTPAYTYPAHSLEPMALKTNHNTEYDFSLNGAPLLKTAVTSLSSDFVLYGATSSCSSSSTKPAKRIPKQCKVPGCTNLVRSRGHCKTHGGGKRCSEPGCNTCSVGGMFCIRHGGGKKCRTQGCENVVQSRGMCKSHGGGARCQVKNCTKSSQGRGLCTSHGISIVVLHVFI